MDVEIERKKIVYNYRIDLIKVLALFLVVLYHSSFLYDNIGIITLSLCSVCVPLFFIVNGYLCITPPHSGKYKLSYKTEESSYTNCRMEFYISIFNYVNQRRGTDHFNCCKKNDK